MAKLSEDCSCGRSWKASMKYCAREQVVSSLKLHLMQLQGLNEQANHHEFCRLLARLKGNYQLNQILSVEGYLDWISQIAMFTVNSFALWQVTKTGLTT